MGGFWFADDFIVWFYVASFLCLDGLTFVVLGLV